MKRYTHNGKTLTLLQWADELKVPVATLRGRIRAGKRGDELFCGSKPPERPNRKRLYA